MRSFSFSSGKREMIQTKESNNRRHIQRTVKLGKDGQKGIDVFLSTSESPEMSNQTPMLEFKPELERIDEVLRTFQCVKCGAVNEEVPCNCGIMKCQICGNSRKNIENDTYFAEWSPDYLVNCLDADDEAFNFKEMCKFNTLHHSERLGGMEGNEPPPSEFAVIDYRATPCRYTGEERTVLPTKKMFGAKTVRTTDYKTYYMLREIDYQFGNDGSEIAKNVMKRNIRLVSALQSNESKVEYKPVQINTWKKILRENAEVLSMLRYQFDPANPPLSPKELGNWTWNFRSAKTKEEKLKAFLRIIPQQVNEMFVQEIRADGETKLIIDFGDDKEIMAEHVRKDWLNLRSRLAAEYRTNHPHSMFRALFPQGRNYYNAWTPMFIKVLDEEVETDSKYMKWLAEDVKAMLAYIKQKYMGSN